MQKVKTHCEDISYNIIKRYYIIIYTDNVPYLFITTYNYIYMYLVP